MITVEQFHTVGLAFDHIEPLLPKHYDEVADKSYKLRPDMNVYRTCASDGRLLMLLAFHNDACIGYSVTVLTPHLHYRDSFIAYNDVLFVLPEYRSTSAGGRLMKATRELAKFRKAVKLQWHAKPDTDLDRVLKKRVRPFETVYQETL